MQGIVCKGREGVCCECWRGRGWWWAWGLVTAVMKVRETNHVALGKDVLGGALQAIPLATETVSDKRKKRSLSLLGQLERHE